MEFRVKLVNGEDLVISSCKGKEDIVEVLEILNPENSLNGAFSGCYRLQRIPEVLPDCVEDITEMCKYCVMLEQFIELPRNCKVARGAFEECVSLTGRVKLNDALEYANDMFMNCVEFDYNNFILANNGKCNNGNRPLEFKNTRSMFANCRRLHHPIACLSMDSSGMYSGTLVPLKEVCEFYETDNDDDDLLKIVFETCVPDLTSVALDIKKNILGIEVDSLQGSNIGSDEFDFCKSEAVYNKESVSDCIKKAEEIIVNIKKDSSISSSNKALYISALRTLVMQAYKESDFNMNPVLTEALNEFDALAEDCEIKASRTVSDAEQVLREVTARDLCNRFLRAVRYSATAIAVKSLINYEGNAINDLARSGYEVKEDGKVYKVSERGLIRNTDGRIISSGRATMEVLDKHTVNAGMANRMSGEALPLHNVKDANVIPSKIEESFTSWSLLKSLCVIAAVIVLLLFIGRIS